MLEESKDIKLGFRYGQARTLFEDDPRWKVSQSFGTIHLSWHYTSFCNKLTCHLTYLAMRPQRDNAILVAPVYGLVLVKAP